MICSGENTAQVKAIADAIDEYFSRDRIKPIGREGMEFGRWVLLDYGDFVVNIFLEEARGYYELERLWKDAPRVPVDHK